MNTADETLARAGGHMAKEEFRRAGYAAVDWAARYLDEVRQYPVIPSVRPGELTRRLPERAPENGESVERILEDFQNLIVPALTHWNHPRFCGYFSISSPGPAILAEMLAATLNVNGMLWQSCPALTELELVVASWLRQWLGLPAQFFGMIHDTASTSTLHAVAAARVFKDPEVLEQGHRRELVVYASEHAHSSIDKAVITLGIGRANLRKIPVDSAYRMRPEELEQAIRRDRDAGRVPCCIVATVGTTSVASVDPLVPIAKIARNYDLWLHVDGAYAAAAAILPEFRWVLEGVEDADSIVVNPHKWLFVPIDCSVFYCRRPEILRRAFSLVPAYLRTSTDSQAVNLMDYAVPLGRRFRALKLWFVMRYYGLTGIQGILRNHMAWAQEFAHWVEQDARFEVVAPVLFSLVVFRFKGTDEDNRNLLEHVNRSGKAFLSGTELAGRFVLRLAIGNIGTTREDVRAIWELIQDLACKLSPRG